jgi:hypothetical protein
MAIIYLNTKSKKTRKQRQKEKDAWEVYKQKYGLVENRGRTQQIVQTWKPQPVTVLRAGAQDFKACKSLDSGDHVATKAPEKKYTGDQIVGLAVMHKSNIVPIFNEQAAKDVANMRRNND